VSRLFSPFTLRDTTFRNRVFVSPMCQYSSDDGMPNDWHLVHLGSRAVGGAGLVMVEATAICPEGRISPSDSGIWSDAHGQAFERITRFVSARGAVPAIQLAHAGRKASTRVPWESDMPETVPPERGGWEVVAPSAIRFSPSYPMPRALEEHEIERVLSDFVAAAERAARAGFEVVEIHAAHGYLLHTFLSPLSNHRTDRWGGTFENRTRIVVEAVRRVRAVFAGPVFVRISGTDWADGGWDLPQSVALARLLKQAGADLVDCSSGGLAVHQKIPVGPGYQVHIARAVRAEAGIPTGAVGLVTDPAQAEAILAAEDADVVLLARAELHDPYWPLHAAHALGDEVKWPVQYERGKPRR
jgi:2,4-dienoyl-CoA reductase-like NADH-dependent reductase (Old Yellow Enzyme family)